VNWAVAGMLVVFAAFILLLIVNPNLSCFGKRLKSPFYPLFRKKALAGRKQAKPIKTEDYGFRLSEGTPAQSQAPQQPLERKPGKPIKTKDYGFRLTDEGPAEKSEESRPDRKRAEDSDAKRE
jgi:hypothetical protein